MHPWPKVAWVLLLTLFSDWLRTALSRDFTIKDIIYLHPSTTPYPGGFKCFTCESAVDNFDCNRWAPDMYCPRETRYCYTRHKMAAAGASVSVTKRCVALDDCLYTGCSDVYDQGHRVCTACCEGNICNMAVPRNESSAVFTTTSPLNRTAALSRHWTLWISVVLLLTHTLSRHWTLWISVVLLLTHSGSVWFCYSHTVSHEVLLLTHILS